MAPFRSYILEHLLMPDYIPTDSLRDETIDDIIAFIQAGEIVTAPLELIRYKGMRGYVMLTNGPSGDGYLFNMDNGGKASATVEYNPAVVNYTSIPVSTQVSPRVTSLWEDTYATSVQGQSQDHPDRKQQGRGGLIGGGGSGQHGQRRILSAGKPGYLHPIARINLAVTRKYKSQCIAKAPSATAGPGITERLILLDNGDVKYYDNENVTLRHQKQR